MLVSIAIIIVLAESGLHAVDSVVSTSSVTIRVPGNTPVPGRVNVRETLIDPSSSLNVRPPVGVLNASAPAACAQEQIKQLIIYTQYVYVTCRAYIGKQPLDQTFIT